jgi:hypothetical protein
MSGLSAAMQQKRRLIVPAAPGIGGDLHAVCHGETQGR